VRVAVVDIGTNSTRLLVAEVADGRLIGELARETEITRLGEGVDGAGRLSPAAMARVRDTSGRYRDRIDRLHADRVVAQYLAVHGNKFTDDAERQIERLKHSGGRQIPNDFEFRSIPGISREVGEKLERVRPGTLGQAGRIPGVTPAAVAILDVYLSLASVS